MNRNKAAPPAPVPAKDDGKSDVPSRKIEPDEDEEDGDIATPKRDRDDEDQAGL
jgi:hypothetical protein